MLSGILAILFAFMGRIDLAPLAILAGAAFDFLDGFVARKLGTNGELGKQLDSLADMVTFGIAPGVIMMVMMTMDVRGFINVPQYEMIHYSFVNFLWDILDGNFEYGLPLFALLIPFFSMFRLAKFNIDTRQSSSFIGLNTPANTLFLMTFPLVLAYSDVSYSPIIAQLFDPVNLVVIIAVMSLMMIAPIPMFSLKIKSFGWKNNEIKYVFLLISTLFILIFKTWSIALIVILYLILSLVENVVLKKKKNEI